MKRKNNINKISLDDLAVKGYTNYAQAVIHGRALPDVRDGLKPVQRRILYAMLADNHLRPDGRFKKCAAVIGTVLAKYHPHGDTAAYGALVRMAQPFVMQEPLVDGHGNFGSIDGDPPAAYRYCVTADTLINTDKGLLPISSLLDEDKIYNENKINISVDSIIDTNKSSKVFNSGMHDIFKVETKSGFSIKGTSNHPILVLTDFNDSGLALSWKKIEDLSVGDFAVLKGNTSLIVSDIPLESYIPASPREDIKFPKTMNSDLAFILGAMTAEGGYHPARIKKSGNKQQAEFYFVNKCEQYYSEFKKALKNVFGDVKHYERQFYDGSKCITIYAKDIVEFLENIGLSKERSVSKCVPFSILQSSRASQSSFLSALYEGDGSVIIQKNGPKVKSARISYTSKSIELLKQVKIMLLNFGIVSGKLMPDEGCNQIQIIGKSNISNFIQKIGFVSNRKDDRSKEIVNSLTMDKSTTGKIPFLSNYIRKKYKNEKLKKVNFDRKYSFKNRKSILESILDYDDLNHISKSFNSDFIFQEITSIRHFGKEQVYSIRVDSDCHSYIGNGFVNHNTESKLTPIAMELLSELSDGVIDMLPNFDGSTTEPPVVPAKFPNILVNGSVGIAVGVATNIPPHNLTETCNALCHLIENPEADTSSLMKFIKCPDFPTGGIIISSKKSIKQMYEEGSGPVEIRATYEIEDGNRGKKHLVFTSIPYGVNKSRLLDSIGSLINNNSLPQATDVRDESTTDIRIVIDLKKNSDPDNVAAYLFSKTSLQSKFHVNMTCLMPLPDGSIIPERASLKKILITFLQFRFECTKKMLENELKDLNSKIHILEGFKKLSKNLPKVVEAVSKSKGREASHNAVKKLLGTTDEQTRAILDTKIYKLNEEDVNKALSELSSLTSKKKEIESLLKSGSKIWNLVKSNLEDVAKNFGKKRQSDFAPRADKSLDFDETSFIPDEDAYFIASKLGFLKRQKSSGNTRLRDDDSVFFSQETNSRNPVVMLTNLGRAYTILAADVPITNGYGDHISTMFSLSDGEQLVAVFPVNDDLNGKYLQTITENGYISRFEIESILTPSTKRGRKFINLGNSDNIARIDISDNLKFDTFLVTRNARVLRNNMSDVPVKPNALKGYKAISLDKDDKIVFVGSFAEHEEFTVDIEGGRNRKFNRKTDYSPRGGKGKRIKKDGRVSKVESK